MSSEGFESVFTTASDGCRLHARIYGAHLEDRLPALCLAGLTRNSTDFHDLALALSGHKHRPRKVVSIDYRGRGLSGRDADWRRYDPRIECEDVLAQCTALGIEEAAVVGTSRGGLVAMAIGAMRPAMLRAVVLNDIGPVIDSQGLIRIRGSVGKLPPPRSMHDAVAILRSVSDARFPGLSDEDWMALAQGTFRDDGGRLAPTYDTALMKGLAELDLDAPLPQLWSLFAGLNHVPVLAIRGENSDLLSDKTLAAMEAAHPACERWVVPGQGHAPLLRDAPTMNRIASFIAHAEDGRAGVKTPAEAGA
ncbi:alpha/beta hydrolase [uncultured Alsobacter sp.]|uniref:alpha/beta fold hydrolase n=1 Tax=uncultured Alsobacter sp. TaxID=1748258 RepID=UPI0025E16886|nr:alpha/beta hydrolase [uncultured Alsobacter sp.]